MAKCKGCGAKVIWLTTKAGKHMICDPEPVLLWRRTGGKQRAVVIDDATGDAEVVACSFQPELDLGTNVAEGGYVPHWATCPKREQFRR